MLEVKNLHVTVEGAKILKGIDFTVNAGEIHAIMGPNGSGKSTFAKVLAGHPAYEITIIEQSDQVGGISKTVNYKDNLIDLGGHRFFSKHDEVLQWWSEIMPLHAEPNINTINY